MAVSLSFDFAMGTLATGGSEQNSNINDFRIGVGHQFGIGRSEYSPTLRIRGGFALNIQTPRFGFGLAIF